MRKIIVMFLVMQFILLLSLTSAIVCEGFETTNCGNIGVSFCESYYIKIGGSNFACMIFENKECKTSSMQCTLYRCADKCSVSGLPKKTNCGNLGRLDSLPSKNCNSFCFCPADAIGSPGTDCRVVFDNSDGGCQIEYNDASKECEWISETTCQYGCLSSYKCPYCPGTDNPTPREYTLKIEGVRDCATGEISSDFNGEFDMIQSGEDSCGWYAQGEVYSTFMYLEGGNTIHISTPNRAPLVGSGTYFSFDFSSSCSERMEALNRIADASSCYVTRGWPQFYGGTATLTPCKDEEKAEFAALRAGAGIKFPEPNDKTARKYGVNPEIIDLKDKVEYEQDFIIKNDEKYLYMNADDKFGCYIDVEDRGSQSISQFLENAEIEVRQGETVLLSGKYSGFGDTSWKVIGDGSETGFEGVFFFSSDEELYNSVNIDNAFSGAVTCNVKYKVDNVDHVAVSSDINLIPRNVKDKKFFDKFGKSAFYVPDFEWKLAISFLSALIANEKVCPSCLKGPGGKRGIPLLLFGTEAIKKRDNLWGFDPVTSLKDYATFASVNSYFAPEDFGINLLVYINRPNYIAREVAKKKQYAIIDTTRSNLKPQNAWKHIGVIIVVDREDYESGLFASKISHMESADYNKGYYSEGNGVSPVVFSDDPDFDSLIRNKLVIAISSENKGFMDDNDYGGQDRLEDIKNKGFLLKYDWIGSLSYFIYDKNFASVNSGIDMPTFNPTSSLEYTLENSRSIRDFIKIKTSPEAVILVNPFDIKAQFNMPYGGANGQSIGSIYFMLDDKITLETLPNPEPFGPITSIVISNSAEEISQENTLNPISKNIVNSLKQRFLDVPRAYPSATYITLGRPMDVPDRLVEIKSCNKCDDFSGTVRKSDSLEESYLTQDSINKRVYSDTLSSLSLMGVRGAYIFDSKIDCGVIGKNNEPLTSRPGYIRYSSFVIPLIDLNKLVNLKTNEIWRHASPGIGIVMGLLTPPAGWVLVGISLISIGVNMYQDINEIINPEMSIINQYSETINNVENFFSSFYKSNVHRAFSSISDFENYLGYNPVTRVSGIPKNAYSCWVAYLTKDINIDADAKAMVVTAYGFDTLKRIQLKIEDLIRIISNIDTLIESDSTCPTLQPDRTDKDNHIPVFNSQLRSIFPEELGSGFISNVQSACSKARRESQRSGELEEIAEKISFNIVNINKAKEEYLESSDENEREEAKVFFNKGVEVLKANFPFTQYSDGKFYECCVEGQGCSRYLSDLETERGAYIRTTIDEIHPIVKRCFVEQMKENRKNALKTLWTAVEAAECYAFGGGGESDFNECQEKVHNILSETPKLSGQTILVEDILNNNVFNKKPLDKNLNLLSKATRFDLRSEALDYLLIFVEDGFNPKISLETMTAKIVGNMKMDMAFTAFSAGIFTGSKLAPALFQLRTISSISFAMKHASAQRDLGIISQTALRIAQSKIILGEAFKIVLLLGPDMLDTATRSIPNLAEACGEHLTQVEPAEFLSGATMREINVGGWVNVRKWGDCMWAASQIILTEGMKYAPYTTMRTPYFQKMIAKLDKEKPAVAKRVMELFALDEQIANKAANRKNLKTQNNPQNENKIKQLEDEIDSLRARRRALEEKPISTESGSEPGCFLAGTKIKMADGSEKNIEDILVGDKVLAWDLENEKAVETDITTTFSRVNNGYYEIEYE